MQKVKNITPEGFRKIVNRFKNPMPVLENNSSKFITIDGLGSNGRLGNQLFQIASTIGIGIKNNVTPIFSSWYCTYTNKDMSLFFKNRLDYKENIIPLNLYNERFFNYHPINYMDNMAIRGYYQSEKYFSHCEEIIRKYFEPTDEITKKVRLVYLKMGLANKKICSVHIRRGDYVDHPVHGVCDLDYYRRAIKKMKEIENIDKFIVFSDDIKWCKKNLEGNNYLFSEELDDIDDLILISFCDHHIISNSSFSWWGSWLCKNPDKKIITPTIWFKPTSNINDRDVFPSNSIKV